MHTMAVVSGTTSECICHTAASASNLFLSMLGVLCTCLNDRKGRTRTVSTSDVRLKPASVAASKRGVHCTLTAMDDDQLEVVLASSFRQRHYKT